MKGWVLDKSATTRNREPEIAAQIDALTGKLCLCPTALLEQLHSARSAKHYDEVSGALRATFLMIDAPPDALDRALDLQRDLAHHHGMWHRIPIPDLLIAVTALHHGLGVVHVDGDFDKIAEVRPLVSRRLG